MSKQIFPKLTGGKNPLGGRPIDSMWTIVDIINSAIVRCKRCDVNISKGSDRIKTHMKKCKGPDSEEEMILSTNEDLPLVLSAPTSSNSAKTNQPAIELFCFLNKLRLEFILTFFSRGS